MARREIITPPDNSFAARNKKLATERRENQNPSAVHETKKPLGRKFAETFIAEDMESVKSYIFADIIVPLIRDGIVSIINQATDMFFYGRSGGGYRVKNKTYGTASYQGYYTNKAKSSSIGTPTRDTSEIAFDTRNLAWEVLEEMKAVVEQFNNLSINDYHDIVERVTGFVPTGSFADEKYGWTDLTQVRVVMNRDGRYILTLPKAVLLD